MANDETFLNSQQNRKLLNVFAYNNDDKYFENYGYCKIIINAVSKTLIIKSDCENLENIEIGFNENFIKVKNYLYICTEIKALSIICFQDETVCVKVFEHLQRQKDFKTLDLNVQQQKLEEHFLTIFFEKTTNENLIDEQIKSIIKNIISSFNDEQKWINILKEKNIYGKIYDCIKSEAVEVGEKDVISTNIKCSMKRQLTTAEINPEEPNVKIAKIEETIEAPSKVKNKVEEFVIASKNPKCEKPKNLETIEHRNFKIIKYEDKKGMIKTRLFLFTSETQEYCYEFKWEGNRLICCGCRNRTYLLKAYYLEDDAAGRKYVEVEKKEHLCEARQYNPGKYLKWKIIKKPNYETTEIDDCGIKRARIIIFEESNRDLCYEFSWKKRQEIYLCLGCRIKAKLCIDEKNDEEYVELENAEHQCVLRPYIQKNYSKQYKIAKNGEYKIEHYTSEGIQRKRLIIFMSDNKNLCHVYNYININNVYYCQKCKKLEKLVEAKLCKKEGDEDGKQFVRYGPHHPFCLPKVYPLMDKEKILRPPDFKIVETFDGKVRPIIFSSKNKSYGYEFFMLKEKTYICCQNKCPGCVKLVQEENGEYYLIMKNAKHTCKPKKYDPLAFETMKVKQPNFKLFYEKNDEKETVNALFIHPKNEKMCYKFYYNPSLKRFSCSKCMGLKTFIAAKLMTDGEEEYLIMMKKKHVCNPIKISTVEKDGIVYVQQSGLQKDKSKIEEISKEKLIESPNFEIQRSRIGIAGGILIIFDKNDRSLCFQHCYRNYDKKFVCRNCEKEGIKVTATLHQNDDGKSFVELGKLNHKCQPLPYQPEQGLIKDFIIFNEGEDENKKRLIAFTSNSRELCYRYSYQKYKGKYRFICNECQRQHKIVNAMIAQDENGEDYVQPGQADHSCSPEKYIAAPNLKIIKANDFELLTNSNGIPDATLLIFTDENKTMIYRYSLTMTNNTYACNGCRYRGTCFFAKLRIRENGEKYLEMEENQHICEPKLYKQPPKKIIYAPNFKVFFKDDETKNARMVIFSNKSKDKCYEYYYDSGKNNFYCLPCKKQKQKSITAKLLQNENNEDYVEMGIAEHGCEPQIFNEEKYFIKKNLKIPASRFKLVANCNGVPNSSLIILTEHDNTLGYIHNKDHQTSSYFYCSGCRTRGGKTRAKVITPPNGDEPYVEMGAEEKHICQPKKYLKTIVKASEFKMYFRDSRKQSSKIVIFTSSNNNNNNKTKCYEYSFRNNTKLHQVFRCMECFAKKKTISARLMKDENGEEFLELSDTPHICEPINFDPIKYCENSDNK